LVEGHVGHELGDVGVVRVVVAGEVAQPGDRGAGPGAVVSDGVAEALGEVDQFVVVERCGPAGPADGSNLGMSGNGLSAEPLQLKCNGSAAANEVFGGSNGHFRPVMDRSIPQLA
ncbi:hypothetical protein ACFV1C_32830, partial [Streptomyces sp. NPDC059605]|uniref:hypothetical protein n=1 Tax=unclassified Streptomyces TaxID=2593676 RepID=UPI0036A8CFC3